MWRQRCATPRPVRCATALTGAGIIHGSVGQVGFSTAQIKENVEALVADLKRTRPSAAKGVYLKKITLSDHHGGRVSPSISHRW